MHSKPCRILILSATFGGGHWSAASALEEYYATHHAGETVVRVIDFFEEFTPSLNILARLAHSQSVHFFPEGHGTFCELSSSLSVNPVVHELKLTGLARASAFIDEWAPDAVISTLPVAGGVAADIKTGRSLIAAIVIMGFGAHGVWLHPATDLYFVMYKDIREDLVIRGIPWERIVVSGTPIRERFGDELDRSQCRRALGLEDRHTVLLTSVSGSATEVGELASKIAEAGIQVAAVAGHDERLRKRLEDVARRAGSLKVFGFTEGMHRMMRAADVFVSKAVGLTVPEALAMRLPLLIFNPVPGQEMHNIDFLVNYGAGLWCRDGSDVLEKAKFLSTHPSRLQQMSDNADALGMPAATQAVCERVLAAV